MGRKLRWTRRNIMLAPVVFLVRLPLLWPLVLLSDLGEKANDFGEWLARRLPGFED